MPPPVILGLKLGDPRRAAVMGFAGAILGPLTEMACVEGGVWTYANTGGLPYVPPWNFPAWACFPLAIWLLARALLRANVPTSCSPKNLFLALVGVGVEIAIFVSFSMNPPAALGGGAILAAALILVFRERTTLVMMGAGALLGPLVESLPISAGAWWYAAPAEIFGMPSYMILAYAIFGGLVGHASQAVGALLAGDVNC
ncbi:MAG: hypothetical protein WCY97_01715 [Methanothrix sp.]|nr:hypothetical protein [Methanothrix sp.]MDD5767988.1 hypothetical protein [Methanothrix sp.]MDI9398832.1 hypothetical protein [Euryarchaeota archaeon]